MDKLLKKTAQEAFKKAVEILGNNCDILPLDGDETEDIAKEFLKLLDNWQGNL